MASIKITSAKSGTGNLENYLKKEEKTQEMLMYGKDCDIDNFTRDFEIIRNLNNKTDGRQHFHIVQSFAPGEVTPEQALEVGKKFADYEKFKGFQVAIVTHKDKDHIHNHIVVNSVSFETGLKFQQSKHDLYRMRDFSDKLCQERGLSVIEKTRERGKIQAYDFKKYKVFEKHAQGKTKSYVIETAVAVEKSLVKSTSKINFIQEMENQGYKTTWTETRKNVTFENQEGQKVRLSNLEKTFNEPKYSKEGLEVEFTRLHRTRQERESGENHTRSAGQNRHDIQHDENNRSTEYNNSESLLRTHRGFEPGQQQFVGDITKEQQSIGESYTDQPGSERGYSREERRQPEVDYQGEYREPKEAKPVNDLNKNNVSRESRGIEKLHFESGSDREKPGTEERGLYSNSGTVRGQAKPENERDERQIETPNKANDSQSVNNFGFNYILDSSDYTEKIKKKYIEKVVDNNRSYENAMIDKKSVEAARRVDLTQYLENKGYMLQKDGIENYKIEEIPGVVVSTGGKWYDFGNDKGGKAIDFIMEYENKSFKEAVKTLTKDQIPGKAIDKPKIKRISEPLISPERALEDKRAYSLSCEDSGHICERIKASNGKRGNLSDRKGKCCFFRKG